MEITTSELYDKIVDLEARLDSTTNQLTQARTDLNSVMVAVNDVENWLDMSCGNKPFMESGKLSWEVVNLKIQVDEMEKKWFGPNIDAMVSI